MNDLFSYWFLMFCYQKGVMCKIKQESEYEVCCFMWCRKKLHRMIDHDTNFLLRREMKLKVVGGSPEAASGQLISFLWSLLFQAHTRASSCGEGWGGFLQVRVCFTCKSTTCDSDTLKKNAFISTICGLYRAVSDLILCCRSCSLITSAPLGKYLK